MTEDEQKAMKGEMTLNVVTEPQDHFTTDDDTYLHKLLDEKKKGEGYSTTVLKTDMDDICRTVMSHWYNFKDAEYDEYKAKNFDQKWKELDNNNMGQLEYEEA